jgi:hypothetical protein
MTPEIEIEEVAYHRNGVAGYPFYVITFQTRYDGGEWMPMVGVVFDYEDVAIKSENEYEAIAPTDGVFRNPRTAVFRRDLLGKGVVAFGANSWRGDHFDGALRSAIVEHMLPTR